MLIQTLLAATTETSNALNPVSLLLNMGLPGLIILALGWYAKKTLAEADARARRFEDDNRRLYSLIAEQMMPALTKSTSAVDRATQLLTDIEERERIDALVEEKAAAVKRRRSPNASD